MRLRTTENIEINRFGSRRRKQIAHWLGVSESTLYRWLRFGLINNLPTSCEQARDVRHNIEKAKEMAHLMRPPSQKGRTSTREIAAQLKGGN